MLDQPVPNPLAKNPNIYTHKVFAAVGLILIGTVIAISVIWYFFINQQPTQLEPLVMDEGWVTYKNEQYGVSFKYPKDLIITESKSFINVQITEGKPELKPQGFSMAITNSPDYKNQIESILKLKINQKIRTIEKDKEIGSTTRLEDRSLGSYKAVVYEGKTENTKGGFLGTTSALVHIEKDFGEDEYYVISHHSLNKDKFDEHQKLFFKILSTVKFI